MKRHTQSRLVVVLACLATASLISWSGCRADGQEKGYVVTPGMHFSVPYDPYDKNPNTANGGTMLAPPEGTVPFGFEPFVYGSSESDAAQAGSDLTSPLVNDEQSLAYGQEVYETFCFVCHGTKGLGDGPIVGPGRFANPPSLLAAKARSRRDGEIYHIITKGKGSMPAYAVQVTPQERWGAVLWVRHLQATNDVAQGGSQ